MTCTENMRRNVSTAQPTSIDNSTTAEKLAQKADYLIRIEKFKTPKRLRALISIAVVALKTDISTHIPVWDAAAATVYTMREREERTHSTSKPCAAIMANGLPSPVTTAAIHSSIRKQLLPLQRLRPCRNCFPSSRSHSMASLYQPVRHAVDISHTIFVLFVCLLFVCNDSDTLRKKRERQTCTHRYNDRGTSKH